MGRRLQVSRLAAVAVRSKPYHYMIVIYSRMLNNSSTEKYLLTAQTKWTLAPRTTVFN